jgi:DUF4097 and DUF4098 domain-containing protein YvlB
MRRTSPAVTHIAFLAAAGFGLAACDVSVGASDYRVREEKRFAVTGPAQIALTTFDGSIEVRGWDRNEVLVEADKYGPDQAIVDRIEIKASQTGNAITIDVAKPSPISTTGFRRSPGASLIVSVPLQTSVAARSGDGSITIRRISGKVDLDTDDGSVRVEDVKGDLVIRTGDGSVEARQIEGRAKATTGDGSIRAEGILKGIDLETRDGSIDVKARPGSAVESDWSVTTGDGGIRMDLASGLNADLDAHSADGGVDVEQLRGQSPAAREGEDPDGPRKSARGKLGSGGKLIKVRSGDGSITIRSW